MLNSSKETLNKLHAAQLVCCARFEKRGKSAKELIVKKRGEQILDEGFRNLLRKAEQGDVEAMVIVGDCYNRGFHTEKDDRKAHQFYRMAADRGHKEAAFMVALSYISGRGAPKNTTSGLEYLRIASEKGLAEAQYYLGSMYQSGQAGILFKNQKAKQYYEKAAIQGFAKAQIALGDMNIINKGPQYSLDQGLFWIVCAYLHGSNAPEESDKAKKRLNRLLSTGLPGGKGRIEEIMENIKVNYTSYIRNPK